MALYWLRVYSNIAGDTLLEMSAFLHAWFQT